MIFICLVGHIVVQMCFTGLFVTTLGVFVRRFSGLELTKKVRE